jgi:hypothetical protein
VTWLDGHWYRFFRIFLVAGKNRNLLLLVQIFSGKNRNLIEQKFGLPFSVDAPFFFELLYDDK